MSKVFTKSRAKRPRRLLVATLSRKEALNPKHFIIMVFILALFSVAFAQLARSELLVPTSDLSSLEIQVFTSDEALLPQVENRAVRAIQVRPDDAMAHYILSLVMIRKFSKEPGDLYILKQASELAQQAIDLDPKNPVGYVAMASILDAMNSQDRALRLLEEAEAKGIKQNWRFSFLRARLLAAESGSGRALNLLERSLSFSDALKPVVVPHVVALLQSEHNEQRLIQKIQEWNSKFPSRIFDLTEAIAYGEMGDHKNAIKKYEDILEVDPENREALINSATTFYQYLNREKDALRNYGHVVSRYGTIMPQSMLAMVYAHMGAANLHMKNHQEAHQWFFKALEIDPENVGILDFIAKSFRDQKAYTHLVGLLKDVNVKFKGLGVYHAILGETLSEHLQRHDEAVKFFSNAIILEPERGDYYNGIGLAFYRNRKFSDALKSFVAATELDPNDATARYNEACVLALLGRSEEAIATLGEAFSIDPRLVYSARVDHDLEFLKKSPKFWDLVKEPTSHASRGKISH